MVCVICSFVVLPNWKKKPKIVVDNEIDERYENNTESKWAFIKMKFFHFLIKFNYMNKETGG